MDETVLEKAVERFDTSITKFEAKQTERVADLQERIEQIEAQGMTGGSIGNTREAKGRKAWETHLRTGNDAELKAMSIVGGADVGGAMVPEVIASQIVERALAMSPLSQIVQRTKVSTSDYVRLLNLRGQAAAWSSETGTRSETASFTMREIRPTHGEMYAVVGVTRWLLQDSQFNVAELIQRNAAEQFAKTLEASIINGDGSNKLTGLLDTAPTTDADDSSPLRAADALQYISGTSDLADDLISLFFSLKNEYRRNAQFVMSSTSLAAVRKLRDSNGSGYLWQQNLSSAIDAPDGLLLGRNVRTTEELDAVGASPANNAILCGDFTVGYELVEIGPMSVIRDEVTDRGRVLFYIFQRVGGRIVDNDAIKVLQA